VPGTVLDERLSVVCGEGCLELTSVQRPGGRPMPAQAFLRGFPVPVGTRLGRPCPATS
jgi:methionyl-tRNA formyltransferase